MLTTLNALTPEKKKRIMEKASRTEAGTIGNVLIVEDNPLNQQLLKRMLTMLNIESETAVSLETARACLTTQTYDLIFMDMNLPDGFGNELAAEIKKINADVRIFILTADVLLQKDMLDPDVVDGLLYKPIRFDDIQKILYS